MDPKDAMLKSLREEIAKLKKLAAAKGLTPAEAAEHEEMAAALEKTVGHLDGDFQEKLEAARIKMKGDLKSIAKRGVCVKSLLGDSENAGVPYLVNTCPDPLMAGRLFYFVREGNHTLGSGDDCDIIIKGLGIAEKHCELQNKNGDVKVVNLNPGAEKKNTIQVNGEGPVLQHSHLKRGDTLHLGRGAHVFRFVEPRADGEPIPEDNPFDLGDLESLEHDMPLDQIESLRFIYPQLRQHLGNDQAKEFLGVFKTAFLQADEANHIGEEMLKDDQHKNLFFDVKFPLTNKLEQGNLIYRMNSHDGAGGDSKLEFTMGPLSWQEHITKMREMHQEWIAAGGKDSDPSKIKNHVDLWSELSIPTIQQLLHHESNKAEEEVQNKKIKCKIKK